MAGYSIGSLLFSTSRAERAGWYRRDGRKRHYDRF